MGISSRRRGDAQELCAGASLDEVDADRQRRPAWATRQPIGLARRFLPGTGHRRRAWAETALSGSRSLRHDPLRATFAVLTFAIGLITAGGVAMAHHSLTTFDREHLIQMIDAVREFKFVNPHASIILEVAGKDARPVIWNLESDTANDPKWDGWSGQTLKP